MEACWILIKGRKELYELKESKGELVRNKRKKTGMKGKDC